MSSPGKNTSLKTAKEIIRHFPDIRFVRSDKFKWDPRASTIYYKASHSEDIWSLLHEIGHMRLRHTDYKYDMDLVKMEVAAWQQAKQLAKKHGVKINHEHVENCIDSYRDWLYKRSKCGRCNQTGWQQQELQYLCLNCGFIWQVSPEQLCRVYRKGLGG